jgi:signal transduction histidine kinase
MANASAAAAGWEEEFAVFMPTAPKEAVADGPSSSTEGGALQAASTLMDSLLHEARNPLNALAINLEVLSEKLKPQEELRASVDKNLKAMREQIFRVDNILRRFAEFIAPRPQPAEKVDLSAIVQSALETVGHEGRKRRIRFSSDVAPQLEIRCSDAAEIHLLVIQPMLQALEKMAAGSQLDVQLSRDGEFISLRIQGPENSAVKPASVDRLCRNNGLALSVSDGLVEIKAKQA